VTIADILDAAHESMMRNPWLSGTPHNRDYLGEGMQRQSKYGRVRVSTAIDHAESDEARRIDAYRAVVAEFHPEYIPTDRSEWRLALDEINERSGMTEPRLLASVRAAAEKIRKDTP